MTGGEGMEGERESLRLWEREEEEGAWVESKGGQREEDKQT